MPKTFAIETFGCQMNKNDTQLIRLSLEKKGYILTSPDRADIVVFNTCSVRKNAEDRAKGRMKSLANRSKITVVVAGCMAQRIGSELVECKIADLAIGPYQSPAMGTIVEEFHASKKRNRLFTSQNPADFAERLESGIADLADESSWHRWVTITHGCENNCSYCIVPSVRGKLISFPSKKILAQVQNMVDQGAVEITLLGQNVNQYGQDNGEIPFYRLLDACASIQGIERLNFLTSHPKDFTADIAHVIASHGNINRSIHLPLQSGSDTVLEKMNRGYTVDGYRKTVESMRGIIGDVSFTTDIIVGFPGESDGDFRDTLAMVVEVIYDDAYLYAYSPREGTPSFILKETISRAEKIDRLNELIAVQRASARKSLEKRIGLTGRCIVEKVSKKSRGDVMGRTFHNHPVVLAGTPADISRTIPIEITGIHGSTLQARPLDQ